MKLDKHGKCPECNKSWDAGDIPLKDREHYTPPYKWSSLIGIEDSEVYDGVSWWKCPHCKTIWDRWTEEKIK